MTKPAVWFFGTIQLFGNYHRLSRTVWASPSSVIIMHLNLNCFFLCRNWASESWFTPDWRVSTSPCGSIFIFTYLWLRTPDAKRWDPEVLRTQHLSHASVTSPMRGIWSKGDDNQLSCTFGKPCLYREQWLISTSEASLTDKAWLGTNLQRQNGTSGGLFSRELTPACALTWNLMKPAARNKRKISTLKINLTIPWCMSCHHLKWWQQRNLFTVFFHLLLLQDWQPGTKEMA